MTLAEAKRAVDCMLDGEVVIVTVADQSSADELVRRSVELGAECHWE